MLLHDLKYELLSTVRNRSFIFWLLLFPIMLGTFFKLSFAGIYENETVFHSVHCAVVETEGGDQFFDMVVDEVSQGEDALLDVIRTDEETARKLLEDGEISGIYFVGEDVRLMVKGEGMNESILMAFADQYLHSRTVIVDAFQKDPVKGISTAVDMMNVREVCREVPVTQGNADNMVQYFYNLIAMTAMYGSLSGMNISINNQANLSALGARKCCSPTPKSKGLLAALLSRMILQTGCMVICVSYLKLVLKIDFGDRLGLVYIAAVIGGFLGVSLGFAISSIGNMGENGKTALALTASMVSCFLSGLMVGGMKGMIVKFAPWFNNINPASVISDCFYCLNVYEDYRRFVTKLITMTVITVIFIILGMVMTRRKKYASL